MGGDGGDSDDGGYGIPSQTAWHCHRHRLSPQPQAAGSRAQALQKGSPEGKSGTRPCLQGVVCYTLQKRAVKTGTVFSAAGVALRAERGEKSPRLHGAFAGCSPAGWQGADGEALPSPPCLPPEGQDRRISLCCVVSDRRRGYPNIAVTAVITVIRLLCERNQPALFLPVVRITNTVVR